MAIEGRYRRIYRIKVVLRVERAIAEKSDSRAVEGIRARTNRSSHHAARRSAVSSRRCADDDGEFLSRIDAQIEAGCCAWRRICVVHDGNGIQKKIEHFRAAAGQGDLLPFTAFEARRYGGLADGVRTAKWGDTSLQGRQLDPVTSIQRELANRGGVHGPGDGRVAQLDLRDRARDFHVLSNGSHLQL